MSDIDTTFNKKNIIEKITSIISKELEVDLDLFIRNYKIYETTHKQVLNIQVVKDIIEKQTQFQDKDLVPSTSHDELRELYNLSLKNVIELNNEITLLKRETMNKYENKYLCEKENIKLEIKETEYIEDKTSENETSENETSDDETSEDEIIPTTNGIVKWNCESESCIITITDDELEEEQQEKTVIIKKEKVETELKLFIQNEDEDLQEEDLEVQTEEEEEQEQKAEEEEEEEQKAEEEEEEEEDEVQTEEEEDEVQTEEEDEVQTEEEEEEEAEKVIPSLVLHQMTLPSHPLEGGANPPPLNLQNRLIPQANYSVNHNNAVHAKEKVEEEVKVEKEEEEEELFEIEIDEITYCTSDEENGIIYEIDKEGDVGKKVGYLKDGEPFFYE